MDWDNYFYAGIPQKAIGVGIGMLNIRAQAKKNNFQFASYQVSVPMGSIKKDLTHYINFFSDAPLESLHWFFYLGVP